MTRPGGSARLLALLLALVAVLALAACGAEEPAEGEFQEAETEGIYIEAGDLHYQVQLSRQLNPGLVSDQAYFEGIPPEDRELGADEIWFGVFMLVENREGEPFRAAEDFEIHDTQENVYRPIKLPEQNAWAYQPRSVRPEETLPFPDTGANERPPQGALILFKIRRFSFDNRPLELLITAPGDAEPSGGINLDV